MDPSSIGPSNTFFMLSGFSVFGTLYVIFMMKETQGLTDREKKILYTPKKYIELEEKEKSNNR